MVGKFLNLVFTPEEEIPDESEAITALLRAGADYVHIRKPKSSEHYVRTLLESIDRNYHCRIKLHDFPALLDNYDVGFHLNSRVRSAECASLSRSCHSIDDVEELSGFDYVTLSPVFDSISKPGYKASVNLDSVSSVSNVPVVGLGGVTLDKMDYLKSKGFSGAALLGDVWSRDDGLEKTVEWLRLRNMRLQYITDGQNPYESVLAALAGGCRWIQVRMKDAPDSEIEDFVKLISPECRHRGATLLIDDRVELAERLKNIVDGVHLGQNDMNPCEARRLLGGDMIIGLTINDLSHLDNDRILFADYYGIGPYRFTTTKKNLARPLGLEGYRAIMNKMVDRNCVKPFVAIGGITVRDISDLAEIGVPGFAVSGSISRAKDPESATEELMKEIQKHYIV